MNKFYLLIALCAISTISYGQASNEKIMYVVDSIPVIKDPEKGDEITQYDVSDIKVITNRDTIKLLGYGAFDRVVLLFTKEYRNRPQDIKQIPSTKQMERKNDIWVYHNSPYTGQFIDYYYSGRKQGEGTLLNGKLNGRRKLYYQNCKLSLERDYTDGVENGLETEYYEDGSLKQKGEFVDGKENGIWDMYFPNGQIKQRSHFINGEMNGETTIYYSTGKVLAVEVIKNGKPIPDKRLEKINQAMSKGHQSSKEDYKSAIKNYSKAIELDSTYAEAYFSRGTVKLNDFLFDEAIADFDKALKFEPYMKFALANRAFARIRKFQFGSSRTLLKNSEVTVMAGSKEKVPIPITERRQICDDLKKASFLGDKSKMIADAISEFCEK